MPTLSPSAMRFACYTLSLLLLGCSGEFVEPPPAAQTGICSRPVATDKATYLGARDRSACSWKGIEFGAPPVGDLRFQFATPSTAGGRLDALDYGNTCMQRIGGHIESHRTRLTFGEDCLNLNIWAPGTLTDGLPRENLPVMVWIHGGGFSSGSGNTELYSGEALTTRDVIVVTLNYRLGALGWLRVEGATDAEGRALSGNFGLSDQILALEWVRDNIAAFGGDPSNVTIFGESAGAGSVCALMASPKAEGLFHQAIMQSGSCIVAGPETHRAESKAWIEDVGCPPTAPASLDCLRNLDADWLSKHAEWPLMRIDAPVVDGVYLLDQPLRSLHTIARQVPLLSGFNADEVKFLGLINMDLLRKMSEPWAETWAHIDAAVGVDAGVKLRAAYPQAQYETPYDFLVAGATDLLFSCPARNNVQTGTKASWLYRFRIEPEGFFLEPYAGSFHGSEIPFVFGNYNFLMMLVSDPEKLDRAKALSDQMQSYWTNFAKTGDPNGAGLPNWAPHGEHEFLMELTTPLGSSAGLFKARCDLWDELAPQEINELLYTFGPALLGLETVF